MSDQQKKARRHPQLAQLEAEQRPPNLASHSWPKKVPFRVPF
jgi:hypothetical protein